MNRTHRRSGFTLLELLVAIGIIAILTAISFPVYRFALARANIARCSSNLRQIGVAMILFAGENNGDLPESGGTIPYGTVDAPPPSGSGKNGWCQQLEPYLGEGSGRGGSGTVFQCPDSSVVIPYNKTYSYFNSAHAAISQTGAFGPVTLQKMTAPSRHIIAGDISSNMFTPTDADKDDYTQDPAFNGNSGVIRIHLGSVNLLFADGHVENARKFDPTTMTTVYGNNNTSYLTP